VLYLLTDIHSLFVNKSSPPPFLETSLLLSTPPTVSEQAQRRAYSSTESRGRRIHACHMIRRNMRA
jgi:hypothetical protein